MEIMELLKVIAIIVWTLVGLTIIGSTIYYIKLCGPMMRSYKNMIKEMGYDGDEA